MSVPQRTPAEEGARTTHRLFVGFDSSRTCQVDDSNLYYVITSPPYWNVEKYKNRGRWALTESYQAHQPWKRR